MSFPKSTPKGVLNYIEYLTEDRDREREARQNFRAFVESKYPEIAKEYDNERLAKEIFGGTKNEG
jgi:predicted RecB family nuclease